MCYAEKLLISRQDQISPMHTHVIKAEDIINRGGATLAIELFGSDDQGNFAEDRGGRVACDGVDREFAAGEILKLAQGESVTLMPGDWHAFWGEAKGNMLYHNISFPRDVDYGGQLEGLVISAIEEQGGDSSEGASITMGLTAMMFGIWVE